MIENVCQFMYILFCLLCLAFISIWIHDKLTCFVGEKAYLTNIEDADIQFKPLGNLMWIDKTASMVSLEICISSGQFGNGWRCKWAKQTGNLLIWWRPFEFCFRIQKLSTDQGI